MPAGRSESLLKLSMTRTMVVDASSDAADGDDRDSFAAEQLLGIRHVSTDSAWVIRDDLARPVTIRSTRPLSSSGSAEAYCRQAATAVAGVAHICIEAALLHRGHLAWLDGHEPG